MNGNRTLTIRGPYFWRKDPLVFECEYSGDSGVYLWSVKTRECDLVYYIGQSKQFDHRFEQHLQAYSLGKYQLHRPQQFRLGVKHQVWEGAWRPKDLWKLNEFERRSGELRPIAEEIVEMMRLWLIPLDHEKRIRERLEGAIASNLRSHEGMVGSFQEDGISYRKRNKSEEPIEFTFEGWERFCGFPESIIV